MENVFSSIHTWTVLQDGQILQDTSKHIHPRYIIKHSSTFRSGAILSPFTIKQSKYFNILLSYRWFYRWLTVMWASPLLRLYVTLSSPFSKRGTSMSPVHVTVTNTCPSNPSSTMLLYLSCTQTIMNMVNIWDRGHLIFYVLQSSENPCIYSYISPWSLDTGCPAACDWPEYSHWTLQALRAGPPGLILLVYWELHLLQSTTKHEMSWTIENISAGKISVLLSCERIY